MYFSEDWLVKALKEAPDDETRRGIKVDFLVSGSDYLHELCSRIMKELDEDADRTGNANLKTFVKFYTVLQDRITGVAIPPADYLNMLDEALGTVRPDYMSGVLLQMIAFEHWSVGQRDRALEIAHMSLGFLPDESNEFYHEAVGWCWFQHGVFYSDLKEYNSALGYFQKAEESGKKAGKNYVVARVHSGIGTIYIQTGDLAEAERYNIMALEGYRACGHQTALSRALNDLGMISRRLGKMKEAENYLSEALRIREELRYYPGLITSQMELAAIYLETGRLTEAEALLKEALMLSERVNIKQKIAQCHRQIYELSKKQNRIDEALAHLEKHYEIKAALAGDEASNRIKHLQQKFATEKSEQEAEIHRLKNVELKTAFDQIEEKNRSILDSINYARRIQYALLANTDMLQAELPEHFVLFRPKDIVSGDFYWAHPGKDCFFLAICDSTGHGVPGAFMSLLNSSFLNEAVGQKALTSPGEIFSYVRKRLGDSISDEEHKDGMDAALVRIDKTGNTVHYAAAYNAPVLVRNGQVTELDADKMPVGRSDKERSFSSFTVEVQRGDMLYLFTDGYADQFGGPKGKKFKHKNLLRLLGEISALSSAEQKKILEERHESWKNGLEQLDDILIAGIRF